MRKHLSPDCCLKRGGKQPLLELSGHMHMRRCWEALLALTFIDNGNHGAQMLILGRGNDEQACAKLVKHPSGEREKQDIGLKPTTVASTQ